MRPGILIAVPVALLLAGCGTKTAQPLPETVVGPLKTPTTTQGPTLPKGDAAAGAKVFVSASCGACHTLKAAGSTGTVGPNLDDLKPELDKIQSQVVNGGGGMPPFKGTLSDAEIKNVVTFERDGLK